MRQRLVPAGHRGEHAPDHQLLVVRGLEGPVALGNDAYQDNYSSQDTFSPVGSAVLGPDFLRKA